MTTPTVLFVGDSVTDCGRRDDPTGLGDGYVRISAAQAAWREDLDEKIAVVRRLAAETSAVVVHADARPAGAGNAAELAADGVHPTARGHAVLAETWLEQAGTATGRTAG
ncbi:hypothetical protein [Xylanimonas sp. McL0601]|uniref:hypothetical protein n=1 Tax=Xylanimonas sp. McL0601 TaxID=3414739 RepID=UPI003CE6FCC4